MGRIIKLQPNYRPRNDYNRTFSVVPKLTLTGKWLEEAGFKASKFVQVECRTNQLIITSIE
ncbi:hypothetical protein MASR2M47_41160 [Draconibacterium sp.]|jgi:hypothetical protein